MASENPQGVAGGGRRGSVRFTIVGEKQMPEILDRARGILDIEYRHELELIQLGKGLASVEDTNSTCDTRNCVC